MWEVLRAPQAYDIDRRLWEFYYECKQINKTTTQISCEGVKLRLAIFYAKIFFAVCWPNDWRIVFNSFLICFEMITWTDFSNGFRKFQPLKVPVHLISNLPVNWFTWLEGRLNPICLKPPSQNIRDNIQFQLYSGVTLIQFDL